MHMPLLVAKSTRAEATTTQCRITSCGTMPSSSLLGSATTDCTAATEAICFESYPSITACSVGKNLPRCRIGTQYERTCSSHCSELSYHSARRYGVSTSATRRCFEGRYCSAPEHRKRERCVYADVRSTRNRPRLQTRQRRSNGSVSRQHARTTSRASCSCSIRHGP